MKNSVTRRCTEGMMSFFEDITTVNPKGESHLVPILSCTPEEAKEWAFSSADQFVQNVHLEGFCQTLKFPVLTLELVDSDFTAKDPLLTYKLNALSVLKEDMDQIVEQIVLKLTSRNHYKLESAVNGEDATSYIKTKKWQFVITLEGLGDQEG